MIDGDVEEDRVVRAPLASVVQIDNSRITARSLSVLVCNFNCSIFSLATLYDLHVPDF